MLIEVDRIGRQGVISEDMRRIIAILMLAITIPSLFATGGTYFGVSAGYDYAHYNVGKDINHETYKVDTHGVTASLQGVSFFGDLLGFGYGVNMKFILKQDASPSASLAEKQFKLVTTSPFFEIRVKGDIAPILSIEAGTGISASFGGTHASINGSDKKMTHTQLNFTMDANISLDLFWELVLKTGARLSIPLLTAYRYDGTFYIISMNGFAVTPYVVLGYNY